MGHEVFLSLGSNMGLCSKNLEKAIAAITMHKGLRLLGRSRVFLTEPQEIIHQPWFYNQVILIDVQNFWTPWSLLTLLKSIERDMGRMDTFPKGPRVIDLDILTFGNRIIDSGILQIPHPSMKKRAFVLVPLRDVCPDFVFPAGEKLGEVLDTIDFTLEKDRIYQKNQ